MALKSIPHEHWCPCGRLWRCYNEFCSDQDPQPCGRCPGHPTLNTMTQIESIGHQVYQIEQLLHNFHLDALAQKAAEIRVALIKEAAQLATLVPRQLGAAR